jgi:hypothetical protein
MQKKTLCLILAAVALILATLACGESTPESKPAETQAPAATSEQAQEPEATKPPEDTATPEPEPTDTPEPTATPAPVYQEPVTLQEVEGVGETVTDNYTWPACQKAVFYYTVEAGAYSVSLILNIHSVDTGEEANLVNEFGMEVDESSGSTFLSIGAGEYYFSSENTDEPWTVRVECQDGQAPVGNELAVEGVGDTVTANYELEPCNKSVFTWTAAPSAAGSASLIVDLCQVGGRRCENIVNEFEMDVTDEISGEVVEKLDGGLYFIVTENTDQAWSVTLECHD